MTPMIFLLILIGQQVYEIEEIVVTATRYPTPLKDVSLATIVINKEEIESQHPASLGELLLNKAGIEIKDYGQAGTASTIMVRGIPGSGVLVLLNGQPINSPQTGVADLGVININAIERIEIVKGPVSNLYGANGLGGVVNIVTEKDENLPGANLKITNRTTSRNEPFQTTEYFLQYIVPVGEFDYLLEGSKSNCAGLRTNSDLSAFYIKPSFGYKRERLQVRFEVSFTARDYGVPGPLPLVDSLHPAPVMGDSTATTRYDRQVDRIGFTKIDINYKPGGDFEIGTKLFSNLHSLKYHRRDFWATADYDYRISTFGANILASRQFNRFGLVCGLDIRYDTLNAHTVSLPGGETTWHASAKNYGLWFLSNAKCVPYFKLNTSLRYDWNSSYGNFLSPQIGGVLELSSKLWIKLSAARAFRSPGFNDLYWPIYGNKELKPEYGNAYELRFEATPSSGLFTALSSFLRQINDRIAWMPTKEGLWKPQNLNYVSIKGIEAESRLHINKRTRISLDCTYLFARQKHQELVYSYYDPLADTTHNAFQETERNAAFIPNLTASLRLDYHLGPNLSLNITNLYTSARKNYYEDWTDAPEIGMDTKTLNGYFVTNVVISRPFFKKVLLAIGVKNIFDRSYATQFGNSIFDRDYPMPGRTLFAELRWQ